MVDEEVEAVADPIVTTDRANFTEPITAVNRNIEILAAMGAAEFNEFVSHQNSLIKRRFEIFRLTEIDRCVEWYE